MATESRHRRLQEVFEAVGDLEPEAQRAELDRLCGDDASLRADVARLLGCESAAAHLDDGARVTFETGGERIGDRIGPYEILEELGEGGMGSVFLARQSEPVQRRVALKIIKLGMRSPEVVARFEAERQALARMSHVGIASVFDAGTTSLGRPYFAMEWVNGKPVTQHCDEHRLSVRDRLRIFVEVCRAIHHAHQKGIIHRDVKPSNVLVVSLEGRAVPKVIDFGIAKATQEPLTEHGDLTGVRQLIGTPAYMSPEQAGLHQRDVDTRTDIYSLGVLLYELLTGGTPLEASSLDEEGLASFHRRLEEVPPEPPSRRIASLPGSEAADIAARRSSEPVRLERSLRGDLDWIVLRCLEAERARRYGSAAELARDVENHLDCLPVLAGPPSASYRFRKFVRRNQTAVGVAVASVLLLVAVTVFFVRALQERSERAEAALADSLLERGRTAALLGNQAVAEKLIWPQFLRDPESSAAYWALWECYSQQPCLASSRLQGTNTWTVCSSVSIDGPLVAVAAGEAGVHLVDTTGASDERHLEVDGTEVLSVGLRLATNLVAAGCEDGSVHVGSLDSSEPLRALHRADAHEDPVRVLEPSATNEWLFTATQEGALRVWDTASGEALASLETGEPISSLGASPTGRWLAVGTLEGSVQLWELSEVGVPTLFWRSEDGHRDHVRRLTFEPSGSVLLSASRDQSLMRWDLSTGARLGRFGIGKNYNVEFAPGGELAASIGLTLELRDPETLESLRSIGVPGYRLGFRDDETIVVANPVRFNVFEVEPHLCRRSARAFEEIAYAIEASPDGSLLAVGSTGGAVHLWDRESLTHAGSLVDRGAQVDAVRFHPSGSQLAAASLDGAVRCWDVRSRELLWQSTGFAESGTALSFSPDGEQVWVGGMDRLTLLRARDGHLLAKVALGDTEIVGLSFSPDGASVAVSLRTHRIVVVDAATLEPLADLRTAAAVWDLDFDAQGIVAGLWDGSVQTFTWPDLEEVRLPKDHATLVRSVAFVPEGVMPGGERALVTGSDDGTLKLWDLDTGRRLLTLDPGAQAIYGVDFLRAGPAAGTLVSSHEDGTIALWDLGYYERHIAGNVRYQLWRRSEELGESLDPAPVLEWASSVLPRTAPASGD